MKTDRSSAVRRGETVHVANKPSQIQTHVEVQKEEMEEEEERLIWNMKLI
jgi:hypothetical protein